MKPARSSFSLFSIFALLVAGVLAQPTFAQQDSAALEETIVTARKVEESLQDIPLTVSAFDAEAIEKRNAQSIDDIARFSPGLSFSKAFGRSTERPVVRGLGNVLAGVQFGVESGTAYFVDGIYYSGDIQGLDISNLERVEVVKGPQSALYGRNTYAGAINFVTKGPSDEFTFTASHSHIPGDEKLDTRLRIGGPIVPGKLNAAFSIRNYEYDGEWKNLVTNKTVGDEKTRSLSAVFDWTPDENQRLRVRFATWEDDDGTRPFFLQQPTANNCYPGWRSLWTRRSVAPTDVMDRLNTLPTPPDSYKNQYYCGEIKERPIALNDGPGVDTPDSLKMELLPHVPTSENITSFVGGGVPFSGVDREVDFYSAQWTTELDSGARWVAQIAYRDEDLRTGSDSDHSAIDSIDFGVIGGYFGLLFSGNAAGAAALANSRPSFFNFADRDETKDKTYEIRFESNPDKRFSYTVGLFYYEENHRNYSLSIDDVKVGEFDAKDSIENTAVYASASYDFTDRFNVSLEFRHSEETKEVLDGPVDWSDTWNNITPRFTANYRLDDEKLLYFVYSEGFKTGGNNGNVGRLNNIPDYDQEDSTNYELGLKSRWWDNRLQINAAVFFADIENVQLTTAVGTQVDGLSSVATNQGDAEVTGFELDVIAALTQDLTFGLTYALSDSEFTEGCDDFQWVLTSGGGRLIDPVNLSSTYNVTYNGGDNGAVDSNGEPLFPGAPAEPSCSIKGHQIPLGSKHQASATLDYERSWSDKGAFFAGVGLSYESKKYTQVHNEAYVGAATLLDARIGFAFNNGITVEVFGRNLTDEDTPILATRWLQAGISSCAAANPQTRAPANCPDDRIRPSSGFGESGPDGGSPRAFFAMPREGAQVGLKLSYSF